MPEQGAPSGWHPGHSPWAIALTVTLATFMEVLDITIVNVALPHIAGGLAVTQDEATWVLTSYLVSNAIVLPISGWLALRMGRKRFYMTCVALFAASSFLCGIATSLGALVCFRVLQGAGGGGLAPSEQSILADTFEPRKRGMAFAVYGMAVVVAPALGPTLGGWLTDSIGWRWIFFLNVPVGIISLLLTSRLLFDPPYIAEMRRRKGIPIDFFGLGLVILGFGALQVVLDKGQEDDWLSSSFIRSFVFISGVSLVLLVIRELRIKHPVVDLRLLRVRNFGICCILIFLVGVVLFGSTVLLPQYEQVLLGYSAEKAGETLSVGALFIIPIMPVVGWLVNRVAARWLVAVGFLVSAIALNVMSNISLGVSFGVLMWWRVLQAIGIAFLFIPITTSMYVGLPQGKNEEAAALLNLGRNLGGSVGISILETLLARRSQLHQSVLVAHTTRYSPEFRTTVTALRAALGHAWVSAPDSLRMAYGNIYAQVRRQAAALAYVDILRILMIGAVLAAIGALLLRANPAGTQAHAP
jgi:MFS transporter, DHA2 family, multidrug resistance protein